MQRIFEYPNISRHLHLINQLHHDGDNLHWPGSSQHKSTNLVLVDTTLRLPTANMNSLIIFLALLKNSECVVKSHDSKNDIFDSSFSLSSCASKGRIQESCHMLCNWDGSCREVVETRKCLCNGYLKTNLLSTAYKVGLVGRYSGQFLEHFHKYKREHNTLQFLLN